MKFFITFLFTFIVSTLALNTYAQKYITLPDGVTRYVPSTHEVVIVRKGPGGLVRVQGADPIKIKDLPVRPDPEDPVKCTPEGELSLGTPPC